MVKVGSLSMGASELDESRVAHYVQTFDQAEPIVVCGDSERSEMTVAAGHHRVEAARRLGRTEIKAEVRPGTHYDATKYPDFGPRVKHSERFPAEA
jgi:ParB-like chromosome segregation protein Spo0J